ncbi:hypothetical protein DMC01_02315 [Campylobacter troglodytis]|nr:hypothetical protein [Campylobacter troglodytis]TQR61271.1 hypothetical protein DMC01_02315 [Campylobacter troglodytis]
MKIFQKGEREVDESYFLQCLACNCVVEGAKRVRGKRGRGALKKHLFLLRATRLVPLQEGMLKL